MTRTSIPITLLLTGALALCLPAQVAQVSALGGTTTHIDMDLVGPPGATTLPDINAAGSLGGANLAALALNPMGSTALTLGGAERGLGVVGGQTALVDPGQTFTPFQATLGLGMPSEGIGVAVSWSGPLTLMFEQGSLTVTLTATATAGVPMFFESTTGWAFEQVQIAPNLLPWGGFVITDLYLQMPEYQVNQVASSLQIDGAISSPSAPIEVTKLVNEPGVITFDSILTMPGWELLVTPSPIVPTSAGAFVTDDGQILGVPLDATPLNNFAWPPLSPFTLPFSLQDPVAVTAQMVVLDPFQPAGFALSAPNRLEVVDPEPDLAWVEPITYTPPPTVVQFIDGFGLDAEVAELPLGTTVVTVSHPFVNAGLGSVSAGYTIQATLLRWIFQAVPGPGGSVGWTPGQAATHTVGTATLSGPALAPGAGSLASFTFTLPSPPCGLYGLTLELDPGDIVAESSESNNDDLHLFFVPSNQRVNINVTTLDATVWLPQSLDPPPPAPPHAVYDFTVSAGTTATTSALVFGEAGLIDGGLGSTASWSPSPPNGQTGLSSTYTFNVTPRVPELCLAVETLNATITAITVDGCSIRQRTELVLVQCF